MNGRRGTLSLRHLGLEHLFLVTHAGNHPPLPLLACSPASEGNAGEQVSETEREGNAHVCH
jgi:hypothetical protein